MDNPILRIREIRIRRGVTQDQCAKALGISRNNYSEIEHERVRLNAIDFIKLCKYLNIDLNSFSDQDSVYLKINKLEYQNIMEIKRFLDSHFK